MATEELTKVCKRCGEAKSATLIEYPPHSMGRFGLHPLCRPCKKLDDAEHRKKPDQKARQKAWRDANKEYARAYNGKYRAGGYSSTEDVARWRAANLEHARAKSAEAERKKRLDPAYRLRCRLRSRIRAMATGRAGRRTDDLLGFSMETLRAHIERQFTRGMSWDRLMAGEVHIDHIIPVSAFQIETVDDPDFKACWALSNLRPLWAEENHRKNAKRVTLL